MLISHLGKLRKDKEMSQKEVSEITGIRPQTLHNIENNKIKQIPVEAVEKLCQLFDCNLDDLFEYIPEEKN